MNKGNKYLKKILIFSIFMGLLCTVSFLAASKTYGYWIGLVNAPANVNKQATVQICESWATVNVVNLDELDPSEYPDPIPEGSLVIKNGEYYMCIDTVSPANNNPDYDPANVPAVNKVCYRKLTEEFTEYNTYNTSSVNSNSDHTHDGPVIYNGKTYFAKHYSSTYVSGAPKPSWLLPAPGTLGGWFYFYELDNYENYKYWFASKLYFAGDIVYNPNHRANGNEGWYIASDVYGEINQGFRPGDSGTAQNMWEKLEDYSNKAFSKGTVVHVETGSGTTLHHYFYKALKNVPAGTPVSNTEYWEAYFDIAN